MNTWQPIEESEVLELIEKARWMLEGLPKSFWKLIRLPNPEKWEQHPWGDKGNGFWVVAIVGKKCIYYNDIEEGFNISPFSTWGNIDEYWCNQTELDELISSIVASRFKINLPRRA